MRGQGLQQAGVLVVGSASISNHVWIIEKLCSYCHSQPPRQPLSATRSSINGMEKAFPKWFEILQHYTTITIGTTQTSNRSLELTEATLLSHSF